MYKVPPRFELKKYKNWDYDISKGKYLSHVLGPTEIWTRIAGFRVQSANHYTMGPCTHCNITGIYVNQKQIGACMLFQ